MVFSQTKLCKKELRCKKSVLLNNTVYVSKQSQYNVTQLFSDKEEKENIEVL